MDLENLARELGGVEGEDKGAAEVNVDSNEIQKESVVMDGQVSFSMIPILSWFEKYKPEEKNPNGPRAIKLKVSGVDPSKTVIFSIPGDSGEFDSMPSRELVLIKPADRYMVPDLDCAVTFLQNNIMFDHVINENITLRMYMSKKTVLLCYLLVNTNHGYIPYSFSEIAVSDEMTISHHSKDQAEMNAILANNVDKDKIQIYYKQITKHIAKINTVGETVDWLLAKQAGVIDINHHIEIEQAILEITQ